MSNEINFLVDDANTTDQETVRIAGKSYPWIQWVYGESTKETRKLGGFSLFGGFFLPKANLDATDKAGWTAETMEYPNEKEPNKPIVVDGFWAKSLSVAFINERHRYEVTASGKGKSYLFAATDYDAAEKLKEELNRSIPDKNNQYKNRKKSQFLVAIKGMEDNPVIITVANTAARRISGQTGLKQAFDRTVMGFVNQELAKAGTNNKLPMRRFWVEVGVSVNPDGTPDHQELGSGTNSKSLTVPSLWNVPAKLTMDYVQSIHTGAANKERFDRLYTETLEWSKSWNGIKAGSSPEAVEATAEATATHTVDAETAAALSNM